MSPWGVLTLCDPQSLHLYNGNGDVLLGSLLAILRGSVPTVAAKLPVANQEPYDVLPRGTIAFELG